MIGPEEFRDHPEPICGDPAYNREIMIKFGEEFSGLPAYNDCYYKSWNKHSKSNRPPQHGPADIFHQPKNNMHVFGPAKTIGDGVHF